MAASALLRRVGLENLIAKTAPEFIELCVRIADDPAYLAKQKARLEAVDLNKVLFDTDEPLYFEKMMEYIIDNHGQLDKKPLIARKLVCL
jgi:predicted O-linked N-acetylglucosamine transferase (SPINDLY family)